MIQRAVEESPPGFETMGLSRPMLAALKKVRYTTPSPIQAALIPEALEGHDVIGQAKTGTGKTASFAIPIIEMLEGRGRGPQAIILAPTRELVQQIVVEIQKLAHGQDVSVCGIYGGEPIEKQLRALDRGVDIIVGTPGRILDHIERRTLNLEGIYHVVLDEADRMLDIGFRPDIERILRKVPDPHQTLLLSATISDEIRALARRYMFEPVEMNLSKDEPSVESIKQYYITVEHDRKYDLLVRLLERDKPSQAIVFTRTKRGADKLAEKLRGKVAGVATIHGDLTQAVRNRVMQGFRNGTIPILVATDVVGRGIDVNDISHVINFDIPDDAENYVHRIGRTGRMGKNGLAYMFVCPDQGEPLTAIENLINKSIPAHKIEGFEAFRREPRREPAFQELFSTTKTRSFAYSRG
ncbi:DEAD/DEAH box helicase [Tundrisphaera sp. TA3]|uniref:DEAD/DEAH box helicase n=1 Tax=Tundrisphaera sp. TA3 TaxID=3435775 RepID=UPI003EBCD2DE